MRLAAPAVPTLALAALLALGPVTILAPLGPTAALADEAVAEVEQDAEVDAAYAEAVADASRIADPVLRDAAIRAAARRFADDEAPAPGALEAMVARVNEFFRTVN